MTPDWRSHVRARREALGLSQQTLAARVGVSRQALTAIEAGRQIPSTSLALQLARALECAVEDLFADVPGPLPARIADGSQLTTSRRAILGRVGGRWVAHPAGRSASAADGLLESGSAVRPFADPRRLEGNVLVAGCAPLLGVLADHVARRSREGRVRWLFANSRRALDLLADGLVHIAGVHLFDGASTDDTASVVRERFGPRPMVIVNLTRWRQGLVLAPGNPLGVREVTDLVRLDGRFARREDGAGAMKLLAACLDAHGVALPDGPLARTHEEVAWFVRAGVADAGMAIEAVARVEDLVFLPLTEERFDLVLREETAHEPCVARLLDTMTEAGFRADARALPGYDVSWSGQTTRVA